MLKKILLSLAILVGMHANAFANVVYTWTAVDTSGGKSPKDFHLSLVFSDAAVERGGASFSFNEFYDPAPGQDLAELHMKIGSLIFTDFFSADIFRPATGSKYRFSGSFGFTESGLLTGGMTFNNGDTEFEISSVGTLFTFDRIAADAPLGEGCPIGSQNCGGSTGYFAVPEPGSIALLCIGALGLACIGRRRRA